MNHKKSIFLESGFVVKQDCEKFSQMEIRLNFQDSCVPMFSADFLGESSDLIDSVALIKTVCEQSENQ